MKKFLYSIAIFSALTAASCSGNQNKSTSDSASATTEKSVASADASGKVYDIADGWMISSNGRPLLVDFSAEWCPPCRQLKPIFASLKSQFEGSVDFATVDTDSMPELAQKYKVESIPCIVFISPQGKEVYRTVGYRTESELKSEISKHLLQ